MSNSVYRIYNYFKLITIIVFRHFLYKYFNRHFKFQFRDNWTFKRIMKIFLTILVITIQIIKYYS